MSLAAWRGGQLHFCQPLAAWPGHRRRGWTAAGSGKLPWEGLFPGGAGRPCRPGGLPGHPRRKQGPRGRPRPGSAPPGRPPHTHTRRSGEQVVRTPPRERDPDPRAAVAWVSGGRHAVAGGRLAPGEGPATSASATGPGGRRHHRTSSRRALVWDLRLSQICPSKKFPHFFDTRLLLSGC